MGRRSVVSAMREMTAAVPSTRLADAPAPGTDASFSFAPDHAVVLADA